MMARRGSATLVPVLTDTSSVTAAATNQRHNDMSLGAADPGRVMVAAIYVRSANQGGVVVMIGGVQATIYEGTPTGDGNADHLLIAVAAVPSGTSGDVVATIAGALRSICHLYSLADAVVSGSATVTSGPATVTNPPGGVTIAVAGLYDPSAQTCSWSDLIKQAETSAATADASSGWNTNGGSVHPDPTWDSPATPSDGVVAVAFQKGP